MLWVCRAGMNARYYDENINNSRIYLSWKGFHFDLGEYKSIDELRPVVAVEKREENKKSVANWSGQILYFTCTMNIGDLVLIPSMGSRTYCLARITGDYHYDHIALNGLYHSRKIVIIRKDIPKTAFSQHIVYSLGAYRTIFKVREEENVLQEIDFWEKNLPEKGSVRFCERQLVDN